MKVPEESQIGWKRLLSMSAGSLKHHVASSLLQLSTVAATAAFLVFVIGEIVVIRASSDLPTAVANPEGHMAQLIWILVVALMVCTISNTVSMLLSVRKRFREIGTRKCLGAFDRSILSLFLVEAALLGGAGAAAGALLGTGFSLLVAVWIHGGIILSEGIVPLLLAASGGAVVVVGCLAFLGAAYPAWQASRMLPVEAMRKMT